VAKARLGSLSITVGPEKMPEIRSALRFALGF
jgi:hypothetical protein